MTVSSINNTITDNAVLTQTPTAPGGLTQDRLETMVVEQVIVSMLLREMLEKQREDDQ